MKSILTTIIYQPLLNVTVFLYSTVGFHDLGLAIIAMTVFLRLALLPLSLKTARSQKEMAAIAPQLDALKERHKGDSAAQSEAIMALYREHNINPLGGCLPLVIQLPILIGIYRVFLNIFNPESLNLLYSFLPHPNSINHIFLGVLDISMPSKILAVAAGILQFVQAKMTTAGQTSSPQTAALNTQMLYLLPVMIIVISWNLPAGLALYWATTTIFSIGEQLYLRMR